MSDQRGASDSEIKKALAAQISETINWKACMDRCSEEKIKFALELGPGTALSKMWNAQYPHIESRSVDDFKSMAGVIAWVQKKLAVSI